MEQLRMAVWPSRSSTCLNTDVPGVSTAAEEEEVGG